MLIDSVCPDYQVSRRYEALVNAPVETVYHALRHGTFITDSVLCRAMIRLRELPSNLMGNPSQIMPNEPLKLGEFLERTPFSLLGERNDEELVIGLIGRFWNVFDTRMTKVKGLKEFHRFSQPGFGKAVMNFHLESCGAQTRLSTETRVFFADHYLRHFRRYWFVVGPFSGLMRRIFLENIKKAAEGMHRTRITRF